MFDTTMYCWASRRPTSRSLQGPLTTQEQSHTAMPWICWGGSRCVWSPGTMGMGISSTPVSKFLITNMVLRIQESVTSFLTSELQKTKKKEKENQEKKKSKKRTERRKRKKWVNEFY
eukprot:PhF_6_TR10440/c0_g2_i2/m.16513